MHVPLFKQTVPLRDRRLVGGPATQALLPLKYKWLYETYKKALNNFWLPTEVSMGNDKLDYPTLRENTKHQYDWLFSMLTTMDMVVTEAIDVSIMRHATAPELRQWLALQGQQEAIHTDSYTVIAEEIGLNPDEVFGRYLQEESLYNKIAMAAEYSDMLDGITDISKPGEMEKFIVAYTFFPLILESSWFYLGLSAGTYPSRFERKMLGTADMFSYIRKDESLHYSVGLTVINDIMHENPDINLREVQTAILDMVTAGLALEDKFARDTYRDLPGLGADAYMEQCRFLMNVNLKRLGMIHPDCVDAEVALPWVSETVELKREFNFFERKNSEYQVSTDLFGNTDEDDDTPNEEPGWNNPLQSLRGL